jgi:hypothetical protein
MRIFVLVSPSIVAPRECREHRRDVAECCIASDSIELLCAVWEFGDNEGSALSHICNFAIGTCRSLSAIAATSFCSGMV